VGLLVMPDRPTISNLWPLAFSCHIQLGLRGSDRTAAGMVTRVPWVMDDGVREAQHLLHMT
jgi:hypothetical protein